MIIVLRKGNSIFLKIFIRFNYFINKKQTKKINISFRIMISPLYSFCYIYFLPSFFFLNWPSIFKKICIISGRVIIEGHGLSCFVITSMISISKIFINSLNEDGFFNYKRLSQITFTHKKKIEVIRFTKNSSKSK